MKNILRIMALILCMIMLIPTGIMGYSNGVEQNSNVQMPKATPTIDSEIENNGAWSAPAYLNDATLGRFWAQNPPTSTANVYFAYDDSALYFAAEIVDNNEANGFIATTGYDNVDNEGSSRPYGWNGDVMTLMLDALGVFERSSYQNTPWYNIGITADGTVKVYRSKVNEADITSSVSAAGEVTEDGWKFEIRIPFSIISSDVSSASSSNLSASQAKLATVGSVSRAACMYMDRYTTGGATSTWGRFITVCQTTYDGSLGVHTNGTSAKAYGIILEHSDLHKHSYGEWITTSPTCTEPGREYRTCGECGYVQSQEIPATGHTAGEETHVDYTCTEDGVTQTLCVSCGEVLSQTVYPAPGHSMGEWYTVEVATDTAHGLTRRDCDNCDYYEEEIIPSTGVPYLSTDNYTINITLGDNINHIRYAVGEYHTASEIKKAESCVNIDSSVISKNLYEGIFTWEMPDGGVYSFWIRMKDGTEHIVSSVDMTYMEQYLSNYGVNITVHNLYGVKDFFVAKGIYNSYSELKGNYIAGVTSVKINGAHDFTYTVALEGDYTVCVRYDDSTRADSILRINIDVLNPTFTANGLQLKVGNLEGVKVIRTAFGAFETVSEIKAAADCRSFTNKAVIKDADSYTVQYRKAGTYSVAVVYKNGYNEIYHYDVQPKVPTVVHSATTVKISDIDGLYLIRYAEGEYTKSSDIKYAKGSKYIRPSEVTDGVVTITDLVPGKTYTFSVQFDDDSLHFYVVTATAEPAIEIGSERQLMLEDYIINSELTDTSFFYASPTKKEAVFTFDKAYEAADTVYHNITQLPDGTYRMYYKATDANNKRRICYIESEDGISWTRPSLATNAYNGKVSNIVTNDSLSPDNLFVFYDTNPNCSSVLRWKGIYGQWGDGLFLEYSSDGSGNNFNFYPDEIKMMGTPESTQGCYFDTLNTVYWDAARGKYVAFVRGFHIDDNYNLSKSALEMIGNSKIRDIRYSESTDCVNWSTPVPLNYSDGNDWQMYANAITPYYRASQLYIGMPTRFTLESGASLPLVDIFLMSSRDLVNWNRTETPFLDDNGSKWEYGDSGYPCVGYIQTPSDYSAYGLDDELSFYMKEYDNSKDCTVLYRYTMRIDGFRGVYGHEQTLTTKTFTFTGDKMLLNYAIAPTGKMRITMIDAQANSISTDWFTGDKVDGVVEFNGSVADFEGKSVTLKFEMTDASFYSFKFE